MSGLRPFEQFKVWKGVVKARRIEASGIKRSYLTGWAEMTKGCTYLFPTLLECRVRRKATFGDVSDLRPCTLTDEQTLVTQARAARVPGLKECQAFGPASLIRFMRNIGLCIQRSDPIPQT